MTTIFALLTNVENLALDTNFLQMIPNSVEVYKLNYYITP